MSNRLSISLQVAVALVFVFSICCVGGMPGGWSKERLADDDVREVVESVQEELEDKSGRRYIKLVPISFTEQVVAGANYNVKVVAVRKNFKISILRLNIFRPLPHTGQETSLTSFREVED